MVEDWPHVASHIMKERNKHRDSLPYRVLLVIIMGGVLTLLLAALTETSPLGRRTLLLILAGVLLIVAIALEVVFRDVARLRERLQNLEKRREP